MLFRSGYLPAYAVDAKDAKWPVHYAVFAESMKFAKNRGPNPEWPRISKAIQTAIQSTLTHQSDAATALATAQADIDIVIGK